MILEVLDPRGGAPDFDAECRPQYEDLFSWLDCQKLPKTFGDEQSFAIC